MLLIASIVNEPPDVSGNTGSVGSNSLHENMPPYLGCRWIGWDGTVLA